MILLNVSNKFFEFTVKGEINSTEGFSAHNLQNLDRLKEIFFFTSGEFTDRTETKIIAGSGCRTLLLVTAATKTNSQPAKVSVKPANPNTTRQTRSVAHPRGHVHGRVFGLLLDQGVKTAGGSVGGNEE